MKIQTDISKFLIRNAIAVWAMAVVTVVVVVVSLVVSVRAVNDSRKMVYAVDKVGDLIPLHLVERREIKLDQVKAHVGDFVDYYYNLNQFNWRKKTDKALYLADVKADWSNKYNGGYYAALTQYNIERQAELAPDDIEAGIGENGRVWFKATVQIVESGPTQLPRKMLLFVRGEVVDTDVNWPNNTRGFFIVNYVEEKIVQVKENKK